MSASADTEKKSRPVRKPKLYVYQDKVGEWRFRLVASNGRTVATGEGYKRVNSLLSTTERYLFEHEVVMTTRKDMMGTFGRKGIG